MARFPGGERGPTLETFDRIAGVLGLLEPARGRKPSRAGVPDADVPDVVRPDDVSPGIPPDPSRLVL